MSWQRRHRTEETSSRAPAFSGCLRGKPGLLIGESNDLLMDRLSQFLGLDSDARVGLTCGGKPEAALNLEQSEPKRTRDTLEFGGYAFVVAAKHHLLRPSETPEWSEEVMQARVPVLAIDVNGDEVLPEHTPPWIEVVGLPCKPSEIERSLYLVLLLAELRLHIGAVLVDDRPPELRDIADVVCCVRRSTVRGVDADEVAGNVSTQHRELACRAVSCDRAAPFLVLHILTIGEAAPPGANTDRADVSGIHLPIATGALIDLSLIGTSGIKCNAAASCDEGALLSDGLDILLRLRPSMLSPDRRDAETRERAMRHCPLIVLTGYREKRHVVRSIRSEADDYVSKQGRHESPDWKESLMDGLGALFELHAQRVRLTELVAAVVNKISQEERAHWLAGQFPERNFWCVDLNEERNILDKLVPPGGLPPFLRCLHGALRAALNVFDTGHSSEGGDVASRMHLLRAALSELTLLSDDIDSGVIESVAASVQSVSQTEILKEKVEWLIDDFSAAQRALAGFIEGRIKPRHGEL